MTIHEFSKKITSALQPLYDEREAAAIAKLYLQTRLKLPYYQLILQKNETLTNEQLSLFEEELCPLQQGCPVQYILGEAEFLGQTFRVTRDTLIPRPETEELVERVQKECALQKIALPHPTIIDLGTGCGCIAISLALLLPNASVYATDISEKALAIAQHNAKELGARVTFAKHDMQDAEHFPFQDVAFDYVVSNPPYIPWSVRSSMHTNVKDFEPSSALFVPDDKPLCFYDSIAKLSQKFLKPTGICHVETFEDYQQELNDLFIERGFTKTTFFKDLNERFRGFKAEK